MSNIHTGVLGTGRGGKKTVAITYDETTNLWSIQTTGSEQLHQSTSLDGALRAALAYEGSDKGVGLLGTAAAFLRILMGVTVK